MAILVDLQHVGASRSDRILFDDLSFTVSDGMRVGIVGINGTGKSTLLRLVAGVDPPESGSVVRGRGTRVGFLEQEPVLPPGTVAEAVGDGWEAEAALERLGMGGSSGRQISTLSGGQTKRVALARTLAREFELLVLDEPTNHLDLPAVAWLEQRLLTWRGGLVIVSHDRHLLDRVTNTMVELDRGRSFVHEGGYASYLDARALREEQAASAEASRRNLARTELAWLRRGAPARTRKPRARIEAATRLVETRAEAPARSGELDLGFGAPRLGDKVIECIAVSYHYPGRDVPVLHDVNLTLDPQDRLGIVGSNGTGKSTLLDLLGGRKLPSSGVVDTGSTVRVGYYDQRGIDLDPIARVREVVAGPTRAPGAPEDIKLMERFWFTGELPFARVGTLSGGERRRLQLLIVLASRPNVLLLDEPTNDLDLDTLRVTEDFLETWPGALVVVSHDRTFLRRTTDRLVALDAGGVLEPVPGGVESWLDRVDAASSPRLVASMGPPSTPASTGSLAGPSPQAPSPQAPSPRRPGPERARSASTVGRLLREAEKDLAKCLRQRDALMEELAATSDHVELRRLGQKLAEAQQALDASEERWLVLAEEAETARR